MRNNIPDSFDCVFSSCPLVVHNNNHNWNENIAPAKMMTVLWTKSERNSKIKNLNYARRQCPCDEISREVTETLRAVDSFDKIKSKKKNNKIAHTYT